MGSTTDPKSGVSRGVIAISVLALLLVSLIPLSQLPGRRDRSEREQVRNAAASACTRLQDEGGSAAIDRAVVAFENDKQLVLSIQARQVQAEIEGSGSSEKVDDLRRSCLEVYNP